MYEFNMQVLTNTLSLDYLRLYCYKEGPKKW